MDDDPWGNAWGSTTEAKSTGPPADKPSSSANATPTWPVSSVPAPTFSDAWGASPAWEATTTVDDSGAGWGNSLEYVDEQPPIHVTLPTESEVDGEPEEQVIEVRA
jgi:hypothetical protein